MNETRKAARESLRVKARKFLDEEASGIAYENARAWEACDEEAISAQMERYPKPIIKWMKANTDWAQCVTDTYMEKETIAKIYADPSLFTAFVDNALFEFFRHTLVDWEQDIHDALVDSGYVKAGGYNDSN
jgi:hypothetical protein